MRICYAVGYYDPAMRTGAQVVERVFTLREFAREMVALGHTVHVVHLFHRDERLTAQGVTYHFVCPSRHLAWMGRLAARILGGWPYPYYQLGTRMLPVIRAFRPDVVHFFGLTMDLNLWLVMRQACVLRWPAIVHFHGGEPARNPLRRRLQRHNLSRAGRLLFSTREHACPWIEAGLIVEAQVVEFMETSSTFRPAPRQSARAETDMTGDPVFVWAGRLHPDKDPLTALRGFEQIVVAWPQAQLYLYYLSNELLPELRAFVDDRPHLAPHVHFRGRVPYERMETIYNSADLILQASRREFSGCAILEAMACGVIPVVTDIPSFRTMTEGGRYGVLFAPGDADALARGVLSLSRADIPARSAAVRDRFERALSFPALSRRLDEIYRSLGQERSDDHFS